MKQLTLALLVLLCIHLIAKSSPPINEDHLRGLKGSSPRRKPLPVYSSVAFDVGFDGQTHEGRFDENADYCPNYPVWKE